MIGISIDLLVVPYGTLTRERASTSANSLARVMYVRDSQTESRTRRDSVRWHSDRIAYPAGVHLEVISAARSWPKRRRSMPIAGSILCVWVSCLMLEAGKEKILHYTENRSVLGIYS